MGGNGISKNLQKTKLKTTKIKIHKAISNLQHGDKHDTTICTLPSIPTALPHHVWLGCPTSIQSPNVRPITKACRFFFPGGSCDVSGVGLSWSCSYLIDQLNAIDPANSPGHVLSEISIASCDHIEHFQFRTVKVTKVQVHFVTDSEPFVRCGKSFPHIYKELLPRLNDWQNM